MRGIMLAVCGCVVWSLAATAQEAAPAVTLKSIVEKRERTLEKSAFAGWNNRIEIALRIEGPAIRNARQYGHLTITRAVDDQGTDLTKKGEGPVDDGSQMNDIQMGGEEAKEVSGFDYTLVLPTTTARAAKKIDVEATLEVRAGGQRKLVQVKKVLSQLGKPVEDPALKAAGVTFELIDPAKPLPLPHMEGAKGKSISAVISGKVDALGAVQIVDREGKALSRGASWSDQEGKRLTTYESEEAIPSDAGLQIELYPGEKVVAAPISLKGIEMP